MTRPRTSSRRLPRVLIVDDDPLIRGVVRAVLDDGSRELEEAASGSEALRSAASRRPDLVLLDVMMPGMDGYEVARRLKGDPRFAATVVVMLSARDASTDRRRGLESGADAYFTKPFSPLELIAAVSGALGA